MKKLFTLLLLTITAFTFKSNAQTGTSCNADFSFSISGAPSGATVSFSPVVSGDTLLNHHFWKFGDGGTSSSVFPVHFYAPGTYSVKHILYRSSNTGGSCIDSVE